MGGIVSAITDAVGLSDTKGVRNAANAQANAIREQTAATVEENRQAAQAAANQQQAMIARQNAADALRAQQDAQTQQQVSLSSAPADNTSVDSTTGRRRTPRDQFFSQSNTGASSGAGISI